MTRVEERNVRTVRVELDGGRVIRVGVWPGHGEEPGEIVLRVSAPEVPPGGRTEDSITLPADALPGLRDALDALAEGVEEA